MADWWSINGASLYSCPELQNVIESCMTLRMRFSEKVDVWHIFLRYFLRAWQTTSFYLKHWKWINTTWIRHVLYTIDYCKSETPELKIAITKMKYGLMTKFVRSWWLDIGQVQVFLSVYRTSTSSQYTNVAILTDQTWSIKDLLYSFRGNFSCGTRWVVPSGQDSSILPVRVANHSAGFDSSWPHTELAIY